MPIKIKVRVRFFVFQWNIGFKAVVPVAHSYNPAQVLFEFVLIGACVPGKQKRNIRIFKIRISDSLFGQNLSPSAEWVHSENALKGWI